MIEIEEVGLLIKEGCDCDEIVRINADELTYNQFFHEFMFKNVPIIIKNVDLLTPASKEWFPENKFNIDIFEDVLKDNIDVPVYNNSKQYFNSHEKTTMKFKDFAEYYRSDDKKDLLYLKDFHLKQQLSELDFYNVPIYFASDWLNECLIDKSSDDYRFVYIGVKGTWTPLHSDVFNSYSWSGNVCGTKQWLMIVPGEEDKLKDKFGQLPMSVDSNMLKEKNVKFFEIIQEPNEILFVPSKWFHQVLNLTDVFSINHNWFNSCNIHDIKDSLFKNWNDVVAEIQDCKNMYDFDKHCQLMTKSLFGMDFKDFVDILIHVGNKRRKLIRSNESLKLFDKFDVGRNLAEYDDQMIDEILKEILDVYVNFLSDSLIQTILTYLHAD